MKCLVKECKAQVVNPTYKGLCPKCYKIAKDLVAAKQATWEGLAEKGLADLGSKEEPSTQNPFLDQFYNS